MRDGSVREEPTNKPAASAAGNSDLNPPELSYNGSLNNSLLYGLPPVIPRLYSNPGSMAGGAEEAAAMARLSAAAGLSGMPPGWSPFGGMGGMSAGHLSGLMSGGGGPMPGGGNPFPPHFAPNSFPNFFGHLGFNPLDFAAMRLPTTTTHSSLPTNAANDLDLKGLDPRAMLSAYMGELGRSNEALQNAAASGMMGLGGNGLPGLARGPESHSQQPLNNSGGGGHNNSSVQHHEPTNAAELMLSQQAEKFKAAAAMYGQRFFPYGIRSFLPEKTRSPSPSANDKASNGTLSPRSPSDSLSPSPSLNSNNNSSNMSSSIKERTGGGGGAGDRDRRGGLGSSGSGGSGARSPVADLKNIERMVEGLHSKEHIFVPTSVAS